MITLIGGAVLLSIVHAMIPNHWIPVVLLGKSEKWGRNETLGITLVVGFAHTASTVLIGILIGLLGVKLSEQFAHFSSQIAPTILIIVGVIYLLLGLKGGHHHHHHHDEISIKKKSKVAIVTALGLAMFLSPCLEIEVFFFTAAGFGWIGIAAVSLIYMTVTVSGMVVLVYFGMLGVQKLNWHFLEHHERTITAGILIALGVMAYYVHF